MVRSVIAKEGLTMDLLTPAQKWAQTPAEHHEPHDHAMPWPQKLTMLASVGVPFLGLIAAIVMLWNRENSVVSVGWTEITLMLVMYAITGFGVTIGFHRLLTHRSFECPRPIRYLLAVCGSIAGQGMCIRWCATHRRHHQLADHEGDPHSPHLHGGGIGGFFRGMWHAHLGWCFDADKPDLQRSIPDLLADRPLVIIDKLYLVWVIGGILMPGVILGLVTMSWQGLVAGVVWGGLVRIFLLHHITWSINSICHVFGTRPYESGDHSTNNYPIAVLSLGEGWHNNHHAFPTSARHGLRWWQFDASWCLITLMKWTGLAWNVRVPNEAALQAKRRL
jgi:stearoyl-CoA desaturase (delta-9 desaturase)